MAIRIVLLASIVIIGLLFVQNKSNSRLKASKKLGILLFLLFAVIAVLFPVLTTDIARILGVGRGTDLLLYLLTIVFIAYALSQYLYSKQTEQKIVRLTRKIALLEADAIEKNK